MSRRRLFWATSLPGPRQFSAGVVVNEADTIVVTAPILRKFYGHRLDDLRKWKVIEKLEEVYGYDVEADEDRELPD